jgi:hypothetical protein
MWKDFTDAFGSKFTGTMYQRVELFVNELQTWIEWHDSAAQHRVQWTAIAAGGAGVTLGLFIGWLVWYL